MELWPSNGDEVAARVSRCKADYKHRAVTYLSPRSGSARGCKIGRRPAASPAYCDEVAALSRGPKPIVKTELWPSHDNEDATHVRTVAITKHYYYNSSFLNIER